MFGIDDAAAATLGAGALGFIGGQLTNDRQADTASSNNAWSAQQYATRYQTQVADLKAAGLNPMLAYSQSPGSAPSAQAVQFQNPMSSAADAIRSSAGAVHNIASADQATKQGNLIDATVEKTKKESRNLDSEEQRLKAVFVNLTEQSALLAQQTQSETIRQKVLTQTVEKMFLENIITREDVNAIKATGSIGRIARELKPTSDMATDLIDALKVWKSKSRKETGTNYDRQGNPSGGFSRETIER
jgi:DNA-binding HxlR family transcriptional regulator